MKPLPEPLLQRVEADEHGIRWQQQMLVAAALCALPGDLHRIDEDQSCRCPAASAIDGEWFSGEAGHVRKRRRVERDRRNFALLRPVTDTHAQERVRDLVLQAYAEYEATATEAAS